MEPITNESLNLFTNKVSILIYNFYFKGVFNNLFLNLILQLSFFPMLFRFQKSSMLSLLVVIGSLNAIYLQNA